MIRSTQKVRPVNSSVAKRERALSVAHDIRKFEIELYWKRATYFWTLIATAIGGFTLLLNVEHAKLDLLAQQLRPILLQILAAVAFLFSVGWYLVNKGSKFWQRNWEAQVDELENEFTGPLYKRVAYRTDDSAWIPTYAYAFSPTAVNQLLSFVVVVATFGLCLAPLPWTSHLSFMFSDWSRTWQVIVFVLTFVGAIAIAWSASNRGIYRQGVPYEVKLRFHERSTQREV